MLSHIEISKNNLIHNLKAFRSLIHPKTKIVSVVKANAYGHGQNEVVSVLDGLTDHFAVDDIEELCLLRRISGKPVLVLGYVEKAGLETAARLDGTICIYDIDRLKILNEIGERLNKKPKIHLKIDAVLGRQGILPDDLESFITQVKNCPNVDLVGVYAHFGNVEDTDDFAHASRQIEVFKNACKTLADAGFRNISTHISSTAGTLVYEENKGVNSLVRVGIGLYGMWPSIGVENKMKPLGLALKPVIRWVSKVAQIKMLPANHPIGYGLTYITKKPTKIAVVPQGYGDGYDRGLSNKGEVLIGGLRCPVLGRVAMNMFVVDATHLNAVKTEDEVVLLGSQGTEKITAEEIAEKLETINYEVTTRISSLLPRIIVD